MDEALESLKGQERNSETMLLESHILYRLGKLDACVDIYQKLQKSKIESLEINFVASLVYTLRSMFISQNNADGTTEALTVKLVKSLIFSYEQAWHRY